MKVVRMLRKQGYVLPSETELHCIDTISGAGKEPQTPYRAEKPQAFALFLIHSY